MVATKHEPVQLLADLLHTLCSPVQQEGVLTEDPTRIAAEALDFRIEPRRDKRIEAIQSVIDLRFRMGLTESN